MWRVLVSLSVVCLACGDSNYGLVEGSPKLTSPWTKLDLPLEGYRVVVTQPKRLVIENTVKDPETVKPTYKAMKMKLMAAGWQTQREWFDDYGSDDVWARGKFMDDQLKCNLSVRVQKKGVRVEISR